MSETLKTIYDRRSIGKLTLPMPTADELSLMLQTAFTAPDHKQLKPWQVVVLTDNALDEFGQVLLSTAKQVAEEQGQSLDDTACTKFINMPKRAPMIIMVATDTKPHDKVPPFEQLLSTGAIIQNLLLAVQSLGYRSIWRSGDLTNHALVKAYFGVADKDDICGFIYVGSSDVVMPEREAIALENFVQFKR